MQIAAILAAHAAYQPFTALPDNLGDGYLYCANPVFRAIRDRASALGVRFTTDDFCGYRVAPLAALGEILRARRVPYEPNAPALAAAEARRPGATLGNVMPLKVNVVLHEAAHCVADRVLPATLVVDGLTPAQAIALRAALGEALANAAELLGAIAVDSPLHRYFFDQNSFSRVEARTQATLQRAIELAGWRGAARLTVLSFVMANTLSRTIDDDGCARLWAVAEVARPRKRADRDALAAVTRIGLGLNPKFRLETAAFYMRYEHGIDDDIFALMAYDAIALLEQDAALRAATLGLGDLLAEAA